MPLTRKAKEQRVAESQKALEGAASAVFVSYSTLGVKDSEELRGKMHEQGVHMRVIPKRLLRIAVQALGVDFDPTTVEGQMAVVWGDDVVAPAKVVYEFAKTRDYIKLAAGVMNGQFLDEAHVLALAQLPSRQELLGQLVGTIAGPLRGFVSVLSGVQRDTVGVLAAIADKKKAEA